MDLLFSVGISVTGSHDAMALLVSLFLSNS